jgi:hypothetical protein
MIESRLNPRVIAAHERAHQERADAFARFFRSIPLLVSTLRMRG